MRANLWLSGILILLATLSRGYALGGNGAIRDGNEAFEKGDFEKAVVYYQQAIADDPQNPVAYFNLGDAYYRLKNFPEAAKAFEQATISEDARLKQWAYYNLGNTYFQMQQYQKAVNYYQKALQLNPQDFDSKFNLELALQRLREQNQQQSQQQQQQNQSPKIEPSEFAKRLKALAEQKVAQHDYEAAYQLMIQGLQKDKTVAAFQDFIQRLGDVVTVIQQSGETI